MHMFEKCTLLLKGDHVEKSKICSLSICQSWLNFGVGIGIKQCSSNHNSYLGTW